MFEILSKKPQSKLAYLELSDELIKWIKESRHNPLHREEIHKQNPGLKELLVMRDPAYVGFTAKLLLDITLLPIQMSIQKVLWTYPFTMMIASRGFSKSFSLAVSGLLKAALFQGTTIIIVGAAWRQAKVIFDYMSGIWENNAHVLRSIFKNRTDGVFKEPDKWTLKLGRSKIICLPLGTGEKIRGMRANVIYCDEFGSVPVHVFETVVGGFGVVTQDPAQAAMIAMERDEKIKKGKWTDRDQIEYEMRPTNQSILSGTVSSKFNHFYLYWKQYKAIIESRGDMSKLEGIIDNEKLSKHLNWKDYCIIRVPYQLVPPNFLQEKTIARAKMTMHSAAFLGEYGACFYDDSDGFYRESLIRKATTSENNPIIVNGREIVFDALIRGDKNKKYVMGIDPAAHVDNFAIVILELHEDHSRVVYCWVTNEKDYKLRLKYDLTVENDYYAFCARKIRDLMKSFNIVAIALDSQGGGNEIRNRLQNEDYLESGELPIWEIIDPDKPKDTDRYKGLHILEIISFSSQKWTSEANHGLRNDLEDLSLMFPEFNSVLVGLAEISDRDMRGQLGDKMEFVPCDNLEDCMYNIEEMKKELICIQYTATPLSNREVWRTPEEVSHHGKKNYQRKDRYSSLLMANYIARKYNRMPIPASYNLVGGVVGHIKSKTDKADRLYSGSEKWENITADLFRAVKRK